nr:caspase family protein [uncultured Lacibacter sp.]
MKQLFLFTLILISGFSSSMAQTCLSGNCSNGFGKFQYANGDMYEGEFYDDKREGFGIYKWKSGEKFIGESLANQFNGFGVMEFRDGTRYIGDFKNGDFEGEGEKTLPNGNKQTGLFAKGVYKGKISYYNKPLGTTGCLNGDCENGYGMKYYSGDDRYFGYFKNGKRHGFGAYYWSDGTKWVGQFEDNKLTGYGTYFFITGEKYVGYFVDSKRNGWGINYDPTTGVKKIGFWVENNLTQPKNGLVSGGTTGCISGDCKNGYGKYVYSNGYYEGYFKNGFRNGNGKYYFDIGDFYVGNFSDNKFNGKGTYYYTNGQRYDGEWKEQRYHGKGQLFNTDGMPENGYYEAGKFLGENTRPSGYDAWVRNNYSSANNNSIASGNNNTPTGNNSGKTNNNTVTANTGNNNNTNKPTVNTKPNNNPQTNNTGNSNNNNQTSYSGGSNIGLNTTNYSKKLALIIGMERYQYITALRNPRNDARSMSKVLRENGFEVIEVIDGGKEQLKNAIKEFGYKLASYQVGLFYYSGHGIQIDDQNYVIPVDANIRSKTDVKDECPSVSWVLRRMEDANTKLNIVILDACRNNPFQRSAFGSENSEGGLAAILPPDNTIISFATDPGSVASDGVAGTNGLYTGSLVKYIAMPNLQIENVFKLTGKEVKEKSGGKQKPWLNSNFYDIFYFK